MSRNKPAPKEQKAIPKKTDAKEIKANEKILNFSIPYPLIWLGLAAIVVYFPTLFYNVTELDDSIFIKDFHAYNEDLGNLITSFQRGLFDAIKDPYYRPLFLDTMILNYKLSDGGQNIMSYHFINILLHLATVLLLYKLFLKLHLSELSAFILTLIFAVHPVLSQAVAWIPGRNDSLLAIFTFSFFIHSIDYSSSGKTKSLLLSCLFLLLAFFTKETAVFVPPVAFILIVFILNKKWLARDNIMQYCCWAGIFAFWFVIRYFAVPQSKGLSITRIATDFIHRLPLVLQYIGKIFLPFNLSVFPIQDDTTYIYGIVAILILFAVIYLNRRRNNRLILAGLVVFLLFLLPVLFVPNNLNEQTFEHRLYLPIFGILLMLSQAVFLQNRLTDKNKLISGVTVAGLLATVNFQHQKSFADPVSFWTQAAETSPHSAYANMMLAARDNNLQESYALFRKAYRLNPKEKYLNFYYGVMLQKQDSVKESEKYLLTEKNSSGYYECDFYLARVAMERKDYSGAISYLQNYLKTDRANKMANSNLLLLFIDTKQIDSAKAQARRMKQIGLDVPAPIASQLGL